MDWFYTMIFLFVYENDLQGLLSVTVIIVTVIVVYRLYTIFLL